jgi:Protein of unknown function (DUF4232)
VVTGVVITAALIALTACAHPADQPSGGLPAVATAPPALPPSTPGPAPAFHPPIDTTDPACTTSQLTISLGDSDGGLSYGAQLLLFHIHGRVCRLTGYPTVALLDHAGRAVGEIHPEPAGYLGGYTATGLNPPLPQVRLVNGSTPSAMIEGIDGPIPGDPPTSAYTAYQIAPPGPHTSIRVPTDTRLTTPTMHPVVPSTTGSYPPAS